MKASNIEKMVTSLSLLDTSIETDYCIYDCYHSMLIYLMNKLTDIHFKPSDICILFEKEYSLKMPYPVVEYFLKGILQKNYIQHNRDDVTDYIIINKGSIQAEAMLVEQKRKEIDHNYNTFIDKYIEYAKEKYSISIKKNDAENNLKEYLNSIVGQIVLSSNKGNLSPYKTDEYKDNNYMCFIDFLVDVISGNEMLKSFIVQFSFGQIITNTIISTDIDENPLNFEGLTVFLDAPIIYYLLGIHGEPVKVAYEEHIKTLYELKANLILLKHNYQEILNNLQSSYRDYEVDFSDYAIKTLRYCRRNAITKTKLGDILDSIDVFLEEHNISVRKDDVNETSNPLFDDMKYYVEHYCQGRESRYLMINNDIQSLLYLYRIRKTGINTDLKNASHIMLTDNDHLIRASNEFNKKHTRDLINPLQSISLLAAYLWFSISSNKRSELIEKKIIADILSRDYVSSKLLEQYCKDLEVRYQNGDFTEQEYYSLKNGKALRILKVKTNNKSLNYDKSVIDDISDKLESDYSRKIDNSIQKSIAPIKESVNESASQIKQLKADLLQNTSKFNAEIENVRVSLKNKIDGLGDSLSAQLKEQTNQINLLTKSLSKQSDLSKANVRRIVSFKIERSVKRVNKRYYICISIAIIFAISLGLPTINSNWNYIDMLNIPRWISNSVVIILLIASAIFGYLHTSIKNLWKKRVVIRELTLIFKNSLSSISSIDFLEISNSELKTYHLGFQVSSDNFGNLEISDMA